MKNLLSLIALLASSLFVNAQCNDLFFSEYIEGSSNNKALEIYNPTAATVDLSDYRIHRNSNGSATSSGNTVLNGLLAPGDVYVATNSQASIANITAQSDTTSGVVSFNGDDAVWLEKISTGDTLDIIGVLGVDPGSFWPVDTGSTVNYTLIRKIGVQTGQVDWTIGATEWDVYAQDMADSLGAHSMTPCGITCTNTTASIFESACESYTAPSGIVYTTTGTYNDTILNVAGCDSIITITLQINNATYGSDVVVACDSYTWTDGNTYTSSTNTATDTLVNANGCDSIVTLNLTINHSTSLTVFVEGCGPSYYIIMGDPTNNFFATSDTIVYDSLLTVNGCDSIVVLDITIHDSYSATDSIVACGNSYTWIDGNTYTSNNNSATYSSSTINGCDSIVTLNLTLIDIDTTYMAGGPYELISNQPNATYQWLDCNNGFAPIPGFTNQTLDGYAGNVCVEITYNGCIDTSACMTVSAGSVAESNPFASVSIYPNPSEGPFTIELNDLTTVDMKLVDITGKSIFSAKGISDSKYVMDAEIPAGVYFLTIKVDAQTRTFRVIKK